MPFSQNETPSSTGSPGYPEERTLVTVPFGNYEIVVCLGQNREFFGIVELRVKKDFLTPGQRVAASGYLDVDDFYRE